MGFTLEASVSVLTVLAQGLLSFFSPCVLPLVPLYVSYLAGGAQTQDENGNPVYPRGKILLNTLFFVLGISFTFFLLGLGMTALGRFFSQNRILFASAGGVIMILFGLYQLGLFGRAGGLEREHRLPFRLDRWAMNPLTALALGFTFSFAWTPCVGPALSSVLIMASSSQTAGAGFLLIGIYTLGFVVPFLVVGLFTGAALSFFSRHRSVVRYTVKIGGVLMIVMGIMTMTGMMNGFTGYLSDSPEETTQEDPDSDIIPAPDFTLTDQYGEEHTLSDYKGKTVFLNFWATWCGPCKLEMPDIQALYEKYGENEGDLVVLGVAGPGIGREGSEEDIRAFLDENGYTFPVLMDPEGQTYYQYNITAFPTTFMITDEGEVFGYVARMLTSEQMESIIEQTMTGVRQ